MTEPLDQLRYLAGKVFDLNASAAVLSWDQQTYMTPGGGEGRAHALSTPQSMAHEHFISDDFGAALESAETAIDGLDPDSDQVRIVWRLKREYEKSRQVPPEWVAEYSRVTALAFEAWTKARAASDFKAFEPHLVKILDLKKSYIDFFKPYDHPYDPLLDDHEPGMKTTTVREIFAELRAEQVPLVEAISEHSDQVDNSFLQLPYDEQDQWDFGLRVVSEIGYDLERGRQDKAPHPFMTYFNRGDVRITNRVLPDFTGGAFFGSMHEAGHAMYGQGISAVLERYPELDSASLGVHESQSRMLENLVGRSRAFWEGWYPTLQEIFPSQLADVEQESFYRGINKVAPSFLRLEADEATYNLHVMLRFEIEIGLIEENISVSDLPELWNSKFQEYLGLTPPDDALGVLQDVHWSYGSIGYFPTYTFGNLIASQLWQQLSSDIPDAERQIASRNYGDLIDWLRENVHRHGGKYDSTTLLQRIVGQGLSTQPYLTYLKDKYGDIYDLE